MQLTIFDQPTNRADSGPHLGVLTPEGVVRLDLPEAPSAGAALKQVIGEYGTVRPRLVDLAGAAPVIPLDRVRLLPPLADPAKILCTLRYPMQHDETDDQLHVFLKAPGSAIGHGGEVVLPRLDGAEVFTHNACLAVVIGRRCRDVGASDWRDVVFGYTAMIDITARTSTLSRWKGGLSALGSSCDTFGPLGPVIVPREDLDDSEGLELLLRCGGDEVRQAVRFDDLDAQLGTAIERASSVMTLWPGDVVAVGGPGAGQGPVQDGDELQIDLRGVGALSVGVHDPQRRRWDRSLRVEQVNS